MSLRTTKTQSTFTALAFALITQVAAGYLFTVHPFYGSPDDGAYPYCSLIAVGSTLYGMTAAGGQYDYGTVFRVGTDGGGFTLLHQFSGDDGSYPLGTPTLAGSVLYGTTSAGGSYDAGTIFKLNIDGTGFTVLHEFSGDDGRYPVGTLALSGSTLYGMTYYGGPSDMGTVFKIDVDGGGFALLHGFGVELGDGAYPLGSLTLSDSTLYGMTMGGGEYWAGTVFQLNTGGGGYSVLHSFAGFPDEGAAPYGTLTVDGDALYGMTVGGGRNMLGTIFRLNTSGGGFEVLHSFSGGPGDGRNPQHGALLLVNSTLYGLTGYGGSGDLGTLFRINTDGTGFEVLHEFSGNDGAHPYGSLILVGSTLYGMTHMGGEGGHGTVFGYVIPEPSTYPLVILGALVLVRSCRRQARFGRGRTRR